MVAFPANQFGCQAPGTSEMERAYAWRKFGFEFPVMDKIAVKDKPVRCKGIDPRSYEEFKDDPDAILTAPLVDDVARAAHDDREAVSCAHAHRADRLGAGAVRIEQHAV